MIHGQRNIRLFKIMLIVFTVSIVWFKIWNLNQRTTKIILLWNSFFEMQDYSFGLGDQPFIDHKCRVSDCFITNEKTHFPWSDIDAIIFHGPEYEFDEKNFPPVRFPSQLYVYFSMESSLNRAVKENLNGLFNLTITPRLDSDVQVPYFRFRDKEGNYISPAFNPLWIQPSTFDLNKYLGIHERKTKTAAWFVSNCKSHSRRENFVKSLQKEISIDVYGSCGPLRCPRLNSSVCFASIKQDYFFYLSLENSICKDYITEKAATPYRYEAIPIIMSGANLTRYLPPNSYLDATKMTRTELISKMKFLMENPQEYIKYFWWKDYYTPTTEDVHVSSTFCNLCERLHSKHESNIYQDLVTWWYGTKDNPVCLT